MVSDHDTGQSLGRTNDYRDEEPKGSYVQFGNNNREKVPAKSADIMLWH